MDDGIDRLPSLVAVVVGLWRGRRVSPVLIFDSGIGVILGNQLVPRVR